MPALRRRSAVPKTPVSPPSSEPTLPRPPAGQRWLVGLMLVTALGAGAYVLWKAGQHPPPVVQDRPTASAPPAAAVDPIVKQWAIHKAATQGLSSAQICLGWMPANPSETASDEETARWFRTVAAQGDATTQYCLGRQSGEVVPQGRRAGQCRRPEHPPPTRALSLLALALTLPQPIRSMAGVSSQPARPHGN